MPWLIGGGVLFFIVVVGGLVRSGDEEAGSDRNPPETSQDSGSSGVATTNEPAEPAPSKKADPYVSAVGRIYAGTKVYYRSAPGEPASLWFTVIDPLVETDGDPLMLVEYDATGDIEYIDRRATMRSPAAMARQLVTDRE